MHNTNEEFLLLHCVAHYKLKRCKLPHFCGIFANLSVPPPKHHRTNPKGSVTPLLATLGNLERNPEGLDLCQIWIASHIFNKTIKNSYFLVWLNPTFQISTFLIPTFHLLFPCCLFPQIKFPCFILSWIKFPCSLLSCFICYSYI